MIGLTEYFVFYNGERPHQSLGNLTPYEVLATASGGVARIVDKFRRNESASCSCEKDGQTSLNYTDFCLDGWVHYKRQGVKVHE
jgi:putative transposase